MPGLRIYHPTLRDCTLIVPHPGDPATGRKPKDYHVTVDPYGYALVSETVWMRLEQARQSDLSPHAFIVVDTVDNPPTQVIGEVEGRTTETWHQVRDAVRQIAPPGVRPRIQKGH